MYAVTWSVFHQLQRFYSELTFQEVRPPIDRLAKLYSRFRRRILGRPGSFFAFSELALREAAELVRVQIGTQPEALIFRSSTRWSRCRPEVPYFVHLDAVFHTYFRNTFCADEFLAGDLRRIYDAECEFLEASAGVFFESAWGLREARTHYRLRGDHYHVVGVAGCLDQSLYPPRPVNDLVILTIAKNFRQKGGDIVEAAYLRLLERHPAARWHIVGGPPDVGTTDLPGVTYEGYLRPDVPQHLERLKMLLGGAAFILHPSREDMNPLVLLEAAGYGCPAVSVQDFAIHELVEHGLTGWLLPRPVTADAVAEAVLNLWENQPGYQNMRNVTWERSRRLFSWDQIGEKLQQHIGAVLS